MNSKRWIAATVSMLACLWLMASPVYAEEASSCRDAKIFERIVDQVCWSCFLPLRIMGVGGDVPDGAADPQPFCMCQDALGVPEYGWQLGYWSPSRLVESVGRPWCSPSLGGIKLQDDLFGLGNPMSSKPDERKLATQQYHWFAYPLFVMLEVLYLQECMDGYMDFDLMYLSELDPLWNNDMTSILLNPEAIVFSTPLARIWCIADCINVTMDIAPETTYGCAGCDGHLYPLTGHVTESSDPVRVSSLVAQRALAGLHRRGLAQKTIGEDAMCEPEYWPTMPRSQYKLSMLYPVPEASNSTERRCCHPLGESIHRWSTAAGGRTRPGMESYVHMLWKYRDCCVRKVDTGGG